MNVYVQRKGDARGKLLGDGVDVELSHGDANLSIFWTKLVMLP